MIGMTVKGKLPTCFWTHCWKRRVWGCRGNHIESIPFGWAKMGNQKVWRDGISRRIREEDEVVWTQIVLLGGVQLGRKVVIRVVEVDNEEDVMEWRMSEERKECILEVE